MYSESQFMTRFNASFSVSSKDGIDYMTSQISDLQMSPAHGSPCLEQAPTPSPSYPAAGPGDGRQCQQRAEHNDQKQYQQWILLAQAVVSLVEEIFVGRRPGTEEAGHGLPRPSPEPLP